MIFTTNTPKTNISENATNHSLLFLVKKSQTLVLSFLQQLIELLDLKKNYHSKNELAALVRHEGHSHSSAVCSFTEEC